MDFAETLFLGDVCPLLPYFWLIFLIFMPYLRNTTMRFIFQARQAGLRAPSKSPDINAAA